MSDREALSEREMFRIYWDVRDGKALPDDARRMMLEFVRYVGRNEPLPHVLRQHFHECFASYLFPPGKTLKAALGIARGQRGNPRSDEGQEERVAAEVLRRRLAKNSLDEAVGQMAMDDGWPFDFARRKETQIRACWARYKQTALLILRLERDIAGHPWSVQEKKQLIKILGKEKWFVKEPCPTPPDNSPNSPA